MGCRFIAVWLCLGFLPPSTAAAEIIDRILAVVEREIITLSDVNGAMRFGLVDIPRDIEPNQATLDRLIERRLTLTEVERYAPPEPAAAMVDAAVEARRARFADSALFEAALASSGLTADQLRRYLRDDLRIETYLQQRFGAALQPTEAELILYYRDHPAEFTRGAELRQPWHRLHVRNRFFSVVGGAPYRILASRDADADVYRSVGRTMRIGDLAQHTIGTSSNLAANVLLGFVGVDWARARLSAAGMSGVDLVRGVEDDRAYESGISNRMTANGLVALLRAIFEGQFASPAHTSDMIEILCGQRFNSGIPAGLPPNVRAVARVAHKTGEISTVTHDGGLVFLPGRPPYVLAVLTEMPGDTSNRFERIATVSERVFAGIADAGAAQTSLRP
ncbi:MAG: serine hydrolase [Acidobacteria bacterium]|nr:serine hydrolase [Acidobacteriota bacterium]